MMNKDTGIDRRSVRRRLIGITALVISLVVPAAHAQWTELNRLGTGDAICKGGVTSAAGLQSWFADNKADVMKMMTDAGMADATDELMAKIAAGDFSEAVINAGQEFQWMGRRAKGVATVKNKVRYTGKVAQPAVAVQVEANCEVHELLIPLTCCNVALIKSSPTPPPGTPALNVVPPESCDAGTAQVTASADDADVELTLVSPDGSESVIAPGAVTLNSPGDYKIRASAVNACGKRSDRRAVASFSVPACPAKPIKASEPLKTTPPPPPKKEEPAKVMVKERGFTPFVAGFLGAQSRTRDLCYCVKDQTEGLIGGRGGILFPLTEKLSLLGQLGAAFNTKEDKWHTAHADVGLEYRIGKSGFFGGGVGVWDLNSSFYRDPTLFLHGGADTPWKMGGGTVQWFVEGRKWLDEPFDDDKYDGDYAGMAGLRVMFK